MLKPIILLEGHITIISYLSERPTVTRDQRMIVGKYSVPYWAKLKPVSTGFNTSLLPLQASHWRCRCWRPEGWVRSCLQELVEQAQLPYRLLPVPVQELVVGRGPRSRRACRSSEQGLEQVCRMRPVAAGKRRPWPRPRRSRQLCSLKLFFDYQLLAI